MNKKLIGIIALCLGFSVVVSFFVFRSTDPSVPPIPLSSLEKQICERVTEEIGDCNNVLFYDARANLVFAESSSGIIPVLTNQEFTNFKEFINPMMDFQEFKEEKTEIGPIDWRVANNIQKDFSIVYGFAEDQVKTIVITSEGNVQPNRFFVRENLWVWYATFQKEIKLPVEIIIYNEDGQQI